MNKKGNIKYQSRNKDYKNNLKKKEDSKSEIKTKQHCN